MTSKTITGIHQPTTVLTWHAVSFIGPDQDPLIIATRSKRKAINLANSLFPSVKVLKVELVEIRKATQPQ